METKKVNSSGIAVKWSLIYLVTSIVITYLFQFINVDPESPFKYVSLLPFIAFLFLTQKEYRDLLGGYMNFGQGFTSGFLFSIISGVLVAVFIYVYFAILSPEMIDRSLGAAQAKLAEKGMSQDQIDKALSITKKYFPVFGAIGSVIFSAFMGVIVGLIGAAIFKKERSPFDVPDAEGSVSEPTV
ncbi:MAG: DUF4199 domain-containing protein [Mucilaginibacter sp.]|uniref:DUF4199 domain-containing protein n=1 Tax=Mucilaginibacter sp. TaxID=1882438 RepID=UPI00319FA55A